MRRQNHYHRIAAVGFVVVSADDLIEPIIAFAEDGLYNPHRPIRRRWSRMI
jgi:hypothetical protein